MAKKRKIHPERILGIIASLLFVVCVAYGAYLYIDMSGILNDKGINTTTFVELGYSEEEATKLSSLDEDLKKVIIQYPINLISYDLAIEEGMNAKDYSHGQEIYEKFDHLELVDVLKMIEKRGEEDQDNIYQTDRFYIDENKERYEAMSEVLYEDNYTSQEEYIRAIVELVNADMDTIDYEDYIDTDMSKGDMILVNKHNFLGSDYIPDNLVDIDTNYGRGQLKEEILEDLYQMMDDCINSKDDMSLYVTSPYRSYETQDSLYNNYVYNYGQASADTFSARPGFSEHQTGLAIDIVAYAGQELSDFEYYEECAWLKSHASEYGFILRYPENKSDVTGYQYEPWHYRYVGKEVAEHYAKLDITYDEYYAFYLS